VEHPTPLKLVATYPFMEQKYNRKVLTYFLHDQRKIDRMKKTVVDAQMNELLQTLQVTKDFRQLTTGEYSSISGSCLKKIDKQFLAKINT